MAKSKVYIAGVGSAEKDSGSSLVSAATKALLDAGITYDNVTRGARRKSLSQGAEAFRAFGDDGVPVSEVDAGSELQSSFTMVQDRGEQCVLVITSDKRSAVALVLVSDVFLARWPYLKDSSILLSKSTSSYRGSVKQGSDELQELCKAVWRLRGWAKASGSTDKTTRLLGFELSRSDGNDVPKWEDVEHRHDGKHRLGYNPASETRELYREDFQAVRASGKKSNGGAIANEFKKEGGDKAVLNRQQKYLTAKM